MPEQWTSSLTAKNGRFKKRQGKQEKRTLNTWPTRGWRKWCKTIVYNTKKDKKKGGQKKKKEEKKEKKMAKGWRNTTVKKKNSLLLVPILGHVREYFLHLCACNSSLLTLYTNIFILDSDDHFLPLSINLLFGLLGPGSFPVLGLSQSWSLQLAPSVGTAWSDQKEILV